MGSILMDKQKCLELCFECAAECEKCYAVAVKGNIEESQRIIQLTRDCADLCITCAQFMARDSESYQALCKACADACEACADACEKMDNDTCQRCEEVCRRCAETCRKMAA
jgi:hypothetical protein